MRVRRLAPEVVQTSSMDCGPASLKCLLEGFGIPVSYGRLREACQTDVDGTSIDTLEDVAVQLGLNAEQVILPSDLLLLPESDALPALVVTVQPAGLTHFVVIWRRHGSWVQLMDPATGRQWVRARDLLKRLYQHQLLVEWEEWREWAGSEDFLAPLLRRLQDLGLEEAAAERLIGEAVAGEGWAPLAILDATARLMAAAVDSGALRAGPEAAQALLVLLERARQEGVAAPKTVAARHWCVRPAPDDADQVIFQGAVLVRVRGLRPDDAEQPQALSPELAAALQAPPSQPLRDLLALAQPTGWRLLAGALLLAAGGVLIEALLFRALFDLGHFLGPAEQRLGAAGAIVLFATGLLLVELWIVQDTLRIGRRLEGRLRMAFLHKIPRLSDRYFQSRLISDMAERSHASHIIRDMPSLGVRLARSTAGLLLTAAGIIWIDPAAAPLAILTALACVGLPLLTAPLLNERELRVRTHGGALVRLYLDAMLGLVAIRTHGAAPAMRREHESLLTGWARAGLSLQRMAVGVEGLTTLTGFALAGWLLIAHLGRSEQSSAALLLVYWALQLPALGRGVAAAARAYPAQRNVALRMMEPLGAPETPRVGSLQAGTGAVAVQLESLHVLAGGHPILQGIDLNIPPGSHVGIVGPSGAGKSSLVGLLLGWHRPAAGRLRIDGQDADAAVIAALRQRTAWVDPEVQLWNRSFLDNILYGSRSAAGVGEAISAADLRDVLERLPDGMQARLGEGGGLLSGGQGQRVRLGRALLRRDAGLVILDEPFRGLDREKRRDLLARSRRWWSEATLLCITHDVGDTRGFDRVIVIEEGRVVEDGPPETLLARPDGRYTALIAAEEKVRATLWSGARWRRLWLADGKVAPR